eukprot:7742847-Pyramimonas_sp.AAC.1
MAPPGYPHSPGGYSAHGVPAPYGAAAGTQITNPGGVYSLSPSVIGAHYGYILSPLPRLVQITNLVEPK